MKSVIIDGIEYVPKEPSSKQDPFIKRLKDRWADGNVEAILNSPPSNKQEPKEVFTWTEQDICNVYDTFVLEKRQSFRSALREYQQSKQPINTDSKERPDGLAIDAGKGTTEEWETLINLWHKFKPSILFGSKKYTQQQMDKAIADAFTNGRAGKCKEWPKYTYNTVKDYLKTIKP